MPGYVNSQGHGNSEDSSIGAGGFGTTQFNHKLHALTWQATPQSWVDLNPVGFDYSIGQAATETSQVGYGSTLPQGSPTGREHALLWHGSAASVVDLHSAAYRQTLALAVHGNSQVGRGFVEGSGEHALLWNGSAASVVDLNPTALGYTSSEAYGVWGSTQVGGGIINSFNHALRWNGTAASAVDMHPPGFDTSRADDIWDTQIVGRAAVGNTTHAVLWNSALTDVIDLHPTGFEESWGESVAAGIQVGIGRLASPATTRALLWYGTAENYVDLHSILLQLDPTFASSQALSVNSKGEVFGSGNRGGVLYAIKWSPVPEPNSFLLLAFCCLLICSESRRHR
jgi:hypothetical protein